ncbi:hypothetical protein CH253_19125 [Rhodococcus sp. 06-156-3C]|uniref:hypothetical protein n=1 Tax=Nocardiaceae TaxID=85025 RepID=UPI0005230121|nr:MULTISPECIES: hypothetical protein [Rhodococcus]OZD12559.1 hypothetical protein CH248_28515 [Rhodococcus sp. 06-156-4a]OZD18032.1 hypothetical protein CH253_19125 [Rhodococcus sp. 06-156-3C]OZD20408.1 hypothetical protein CH280_04470 [Rhodococcus sp. 06-156-4C]OZD29252.1 hypothetical protein CH284_27325 [Rhodococcus sp. 06-156-3]OZD30524.1 hypothetical protein CH247_14450 [Rhodococcus sp. 06-156-3b]
MTSIGSTCTFPLPTPALRFTNSASMRLSRRPLLLALTLLAQSSPMLHLREEPALPSHLTLLVVADREVTQLHQTSNTYRVRAE